MMVQKSNEVKEGHVLTRKSANCLYRGTNCKKKSVLLQAKHQEQLLRSIDLLMVANSPTEFTGTTVVKVRCGSFLYSLKHFKHFLT